MGSDASLSQFLYRCSRPSSPSPSSSCHVGWGAPVTVRRRQLLRVVGWLHSNRGISHFTRPSLFICSRIYSLQKGAFAASWLLEVPPGARSGMICMVTSSSCRLYIHVGYHRGQKSCPFLLVPAWLATRGNLHSNTFRTLSMLQLLWRSSIAIRVQCAHIDRVVPCVLVWSHTHNPFLARS